MCEVEFDEKNEELHMDFSTDDYGIALEFHINLLTELVIILSTVKEPEWYFEDREDIKEIPKNKEEWLAADEDIFVGIEDSIIEATNEKNSCKSVIK